LSPRDKHQLSHNVSCFNDILTWRITASKKIDGHFTDEPMLHFAEEQVELCDEVFEDCANNLQLEFA
jgi:hypothetical protein